MNASKQVLRAPWVGLLNEAIHHGGRRNKRLIKANKYVQLATTGPDGRPHVRTVVFRGFYQHVTKVEEGVGPARYSPSAMMFITDARSEKIRDLRSNSFAEVAQNQPSCSARASRTNCCNYDRCAAGLRVRRASFAWPVG
jgi:hypothetical protein